MPGDTDCADFPVDGVARCAVPAYGICILSLLVCEVPLEPIELLRGAAGRFVPCGGNAANMPRRKLRGRTGFRGMDCAGQGWRKEVFERKNDGGVGWPGIANAPHGL